MNGGMGVRQLHRGDEQSHPEKHCKALGLVVARPPDRAMSATEGLLSNDSPSTENFRSWYNRPGR